MVPTDVRAAVRALAARPRFLALTLVTLGLGIGASTAIFSVVHAVLLRALPYRDPDALYYLEIARTDGSTETMSILDFEDYRRDARTFAGMAAWQELGMNVTGDGDPERVLAARVSAGFFDVLGAPAAVGRTLAADEYEAGGAHVVVLGDAFWRRRFAGDPTIVGRDIIL